MPSTTGSSRSAGDKSVVYVRCHLNGCTARVLLGTATEQVRVRNESIAFYGKAQGLVLDVCGEHFAAITLWAIETQRIEVPAAYFMALAVA